VPAGVERAGGQAHLGKALKVKGKISGVEDLHVDGEVEGTIELEQHAVTIGPNGQVNADIKARQVTVLGRLTGSVTAGERVEIRKTGSMEGDVTTNRIVIEDGAVFRGRIDIVKPEEVSAKPKPVAGSEKSAAQAAPLAKSAAAAPGGAPADK
jgi:cytoskeletal protein CcmA (bactofilin family)